MPQSAAQMLLDAAETLREEQFRVTNQIAYTAPELISAETKQWLATNLAMIDLFEHAAKEPPARAWHQKVVALAEALLTDPA